MSSLRGCFQGTPGPPPSFITAGERADFLRSNSNEEANEEPPRCVELLRTRELNELWRRRPHDVPVFSDQSFRCHAGLKFALFQARCATYVRIGPAGIECVASLVNDRFDNCWALSPDFVERGMATANLPPHAWWRNGPLLCNQMPPGLWSDGYLPQLWELLHAAVQRFPDIGPCEFLLNKRDAPLLPRHMTFSPKLLREVHRLLPGLTPKDLDDGMAEGTEGKTLTSAHLLPVLSQYTDPLHHDDIPIPTVAEYELATGRFYLHAGRGPPMMDTPGRPLHERRPTAFFRGSATGYGVTAQTNPRLRAVLLSYQWARDPRRRGKLDARLTGLNQRPKIQPNGRLLQIDPRRVLPSACTRNLHRNRVSYTTMMDYRFLLYIDGNSGADRLAAYLKSGSVVLIVAPQAPPVQLLSSLVPWVHFVPVARDLTDLEETIDFLREHPEVCTRIVREAQAVYEATCNVDAIVERMAVALRHAQHKYGTSP